MPRGYTLLELLFALALIVTLAGITVPFVLEGLDRALPPRPRISPRG